MLKFKKTKFNPYFPNQIISFIDDIVNTNLDIAQSYIAGKTFENRQLKVIKIKAPNTSTSKAVWIGEFSKTNFHLILLIISSDSKNEYKGIVCFESTFKNYRKNNQN